MILRALTEESAMVAEAVANAANKDVFNTGQTSKDWFARRIKYQRTKNQKVGCQLHAEWSRLTYHVGTGNLASEPWHGAPT